MATHRFSVLGNVNMDTTVFTSLIGAQITSATAPSIGTQFCFVLSDAGGTDKGVYLNFAIPKNYIGSPVLVVKGVLDGAPSAAHTLGFGFRKRAVADNEAADGTFDAEQTASATIGSNGLTYADEDSLAMSITLTAGDYAVDDEVFGYLYWDASAADYTGNFLLTDILFQYADA